ncbi:MULTISPECIES: hypothetical protein [unclassified Streptomyces]|uniref:hypothetical protein n=1 Tax=unclassified Streptomyces TaxID=2593676 RepID=UPI0011603507|nr:MULTISPECIES: hypothetical protein [unclassified Streptomyces]
MLYGDEARYLRYLGFHTATFAFDAPDVHARLRNRFCLTDTLARQMGLPAVPSCARSWGRAERGVGRADSSTPPSRAAAGTSARMRAARALPAVEL